MSDDDSSLARGADSVMEAHNRYKDVDKWHPEVLLLADQVRQHNLAFDRYALKALYSIEMGPQFLQKLFRREAKKAEKGDSDVPEEVFGKGRCFIVGKHDEAAAQLRMKLKFKDPQSKVHFRTKEGGLMHIQFFIRDLVYIVCNSGKIPLQMNIELIPTCLRWNCVAFCHGSWAEAGEFDERCDTCGDRGWAFVKTQHKRDGGYICACRHKPFCLLAKDVSDGGVLKFRKRKTLKANLKEFWKKSLST